MKIILLSLCACVVMGCSNQGAYESIQISNRLECSKLPESQYDECMTNTNKSYNDYERERQEILKQ